MTFAGFPSRGQATAIPNAFFADVLPELHDGVALGVTLLAFNLIAKKKGYPRYFSSEEMAAEPALVSLMEHAGAAPGAASAGLSRAVELGVLLTVSVERDGRCRELYFLNTPADRRGYEAIQSGEIDVGTIIEPVAAGAPKSVFALYESLIGPVSPLVAGDLAEAERLYPAEWLEAAFREAAAQNARSWRYVTRILERWAVEGPDHAKTGGDPAGARYLSGKYGRILKQRLTP